MTTGSEHPAMTAIDDLLSRSLLLHDPHVPSDTVPYEDTAYPAFAPDGTPLWDVGGGDLADDNAARSLRALCEAVVVHATPGQLADFVTEQLPSPRGAWILGCVLQLADERDGARFWWQYAAGAGEPAASYCLYLHHLALGDRQAAALWHKQAGDDAPADSGLGVDTSIPTVLRILSGLAPTAPRDRTETFIAVKAYVTTAVAAGYARNPGYEIPLPGPHFAEQLEIILAATSAASRSVRQAEPPATGLPNRTRPRADAGDRSGDSAHEPERLLVETAARDESASSFFREALAACWETAVADRTARGADRRDVRLRYLLDRRPTEPTSWR
ncbi:DUF6207 family protein [Streptomyces sp. NPDC050546]|uniref:DUF6207 family protein n=1 Tax=Streptomyces sp. NPDC050546 TaxID=3365628 RepID=UPI0037ADC26B